MDWKRAKTILIIMFLVINAFLFYQLIATSRDQYKYISSQELTSIKQYMSSKNIKINTEIPDRVQGIPSLKIKYDQFDFERVKKLFFTDKQYKMSRIDEGFVITSGDISVEVKNGIYLTYTNKAIQIKQSEVKKEKCLSQIDRFIEGLRLNTGNRYVKISEIQNGYMRMVLGQEYKKIPVESSQLEVIATEEGVVQAKINWFESIKPDKNINITTPVVALLKAYENKKSDDAPININKIRRGYYFNVNRLKDSQEGIPLEGIVFPMWVIESDKNKIYINAYNEEIENVQ